MFEARVVRMRQLLDGAATLAQSPALSRHFSVLRAPNPVLSGPLRRRFLVKQGHSSAICELDLSGMDDFITVLSATTDNVGLLDTVRERHGNDPFLWLPELLREVQDRKSRTSRSAP